MNIQLMTADKTDQAEIHGEDLNCPSQVVFPEDEDIPPLPPPMPSLNLE